MRYIQHWFYYGPENNRRIRGIRYCQETGRAQVAVTSQIVKEEEGTDRDDVIVTTRSGSVYCLVNKIRPEESSKFWPLTVWDSRW